MTNILTHFLQLIFRRRVQRVPVRVHRGLFIAILATAVMAVSPLDTWAQRGSTSSGKTKRTERTVDRSKRSNKATPAKRSSRTKSSRADRTRSRASTARKAGRVIQDARAGRKNSNARSGSDRNRNSSNARSSGDRDRNSSDARSSRDRSRENASARSNQRASKTRDHRGASAGRTGQRVLDRSANGRVAAARGASRSSRDRNLVISGRRARLSLPGVRASWRSQGNRHVRFRTRLHVSPKRYYYRSPHKHISVHIAWPWKVRYHRHWSPRYRYRQVVIVNADWNSSYRTSRIEMETTYRHRVRFATDEYAVLDIDIEQVALYDNGRYIGMVDRIPSSLSSIEATVFRNGDIAFDRDVFLVGDRQAGFEIISTPFYDGYAGQGYRYGDDVRVGKVNLRRNRVSSRSYSRLFDPNRWRGYAPISLLPEDEGWLWDFGADAISAAYDDYDAYYGFGAGASGGWSSRDAFETQSSFGYETAFGAQFNMERTASIRRVE